MNHQEASALLSAHGQSHLLAFWDRLDEPSRTSLLAQIEALDMGRRGLHNEGSELLRERLDGKIEVDHDTARRLFTLICALLIKS